MSEKKKTQLSRRNFLKVGGLVGIATQVATIPFRAYEAGASKESYTGWESFEGQTQYFDRKPFEITLDKLYAKFHPNTGEKKTRPDKYTEMAFNRVLQIMPLIFEAAIQAELLNPPAKEGEMPTPAKEITEKDLVGLKKLIYGMLPDKYFKNYYDYWAKRHQDQLLDDIRTVLIHTPRQAADKKRLAVYLALHTAYGAVVDDLGNGKLVEPPEPTAPPEESDFKAGLAVFPGMPQPFVDIRQVTPATLTPERLEFKSPKEAANLIKIVAHKFGATVVGITTMNPDFVYVRSVRGSTPAVPPDGGSPAPGTVSPLFKGDMKEFEVPKHWKYVIVVGIPHEWDQLLEAPHLGFSGEAYIRLRVLGARLVGYLKQLGYSARGHLPGMDYDLVVPPFAVMAGLGQLGRLGVVITPEAGPNMRWAAITTDLEMAVDQPIDFGVLEFCKKCKICAENCPTNSISMADSPKGQGSRGYERWDFNGATCFGMWQQALGDGCRLCIAVCPYSRKNNWVHGIPRSLSPVDPTGLVDRSFIWLQKTFFAAPTKQQYLPEPDGCSATYRQTAKWIHTASWLKNPHEKPKPCK